MTSVLGMCDKNHDYALTCVKLRALRAHSFGRMAILDYVRHCLAEFWEAG